MEKLRTDLIALAATPSVELGKIQTALEVLKNVAPTEQNDGRLLSESEARFFLGKVSRSTLYAYRLRGLKSLKLGPGRGARRVFNKKELIRFAEKEASMN